MNIDVRAVAKMTLAGAIAGTAVTTQIAAFQQANESKGVQETLFMGAGIGAVFLGLGIVATMYGNPMQSAKLGTGLLGSAALVGAGALFALPGLSLSD